MKNTLAMALCLFTVSACLTGSVFVLATTAAPHLPRAAISAQPATRASETGHSHHFVTPAEPKAQPRPGLHEVEETLNL